MRAAKAGLHGLFAVYKPPGTPWKLVRDTVETKLLSELNSLERPPPRQQIRFLPAMVEGKDGKELTLTVTQLPMLADHPLVSGPVFTHLRVGAGHRLDKQSSGVFVLGVGGGNKLLDEVYHAHLSRTYTVRGLFGKATDDFSDTGKLIEKTTFDHITGEKLERILAVIQGSNHKALLQYANIDLKTQEAYELAVRGLIQPMEKSPPLITTIRCLQFAPPEFQLEIHCLHETQQYLRKLVHEIGLELKSTAVCTQVRRIRDGAFTLDDALLRTQWTLQNIQNAILQSRPKVKTELRKSTEYQKIFAASEQSREAGLSEAAGEQQHSEGAMPGQQY
ncbi:pseudouridylate synthase TRUB2, mitochondrial isoform X1 [Heteronotia binoei]|uniref:pseudouridylate synthase TRUB2, mitochondrial isoform X1 n=1 Tax=Heteronotia binoei TaxID=13085 RepID=UPI00292FA504|nr:pseudouridylate synthase TRUB2, mitochondrial isoform X1 [Heteronotia binoei]